MKLKFLSALFSVLLMSGAVFAQGGNSMNMQINDKGVSVTSDEGSFSITDDAVTVNSKEYKRGDCEINGKKVPCDQMVGDIGKGVGILFAFAGFMFFILGLVSLALFVLWIVTLVHAIDKPIENKGIWIVVLILTGGLGSIFYYFLVMRPFNKANKIAPAQNQSAPQQNSTN